MASDTQISNFLERLEKLFETKFVLNEVVLKTWIDAFRFCNAPVLDQALQKWVEKSPKCPTLSDIRGEALRLSGGTFYRKKEQNELWEMQDPDIVTVQYMQDGRTISRNMRKADCVKLRGKWTPKIEAVLNYFGEDEWCEVLKEKFNITREKKYTEFSKIFENKQTLELYKTLITEHAQMAVEALERR